MNFDKDDEKAKPVIPDSTLGDDNKGFQALANKKAAQNGSPAPRMAPITTSSMADGLRSLLKGKGYADGGDVSDDSAADQLAALLSNGGNPPPSENGAQFMQGAGQNLMSMPEAGTTPPPADPGTTSQLGALMSTGLPFMSGTAQPQSGAPTPPMAMPAPSTAPMPSAPQPQAAQSGHPDIMALSKALSSAPDTSPDIYKGISADDRLALQRKLMAGRNSIGSLIGQGLAGLGDAVNNSYGHGHSEFLKNTQDNMAKQRAETLEGVDTARAQKLQDVQGPMAAQMADPKSPLAASMRKTLKSAGLNVPSGMPPSVMLQISGPLGELAMKQATLSVQQQQVSATERNQEAERHLQSAKDLQDRGIVRKGWEALTGDSPETAAMREELHSTGANHGAAPHGIPDLGSTFNGHKVLSVKRIQ